MKKILALSLVAIGLIAADIPLKINGKIVMEKHPLPFNVLSQESGGPLSAIDAYSDGVGVMLVSSPTSGVQIDNSGFNSLVYKHGDMAKKLNAPLKDYVLMNGSDEEKLAANLFEDERINGNSCDDGNPDTVNDKWVNGSCIGEDSLYVNAVWGSPYFDDIAKATYGSFNINEKYRDKNGKYGSVTSLGYSKKCKYTNGLFYSSGSSIPRVKKVLTTTRSRPVTYYTLWFKYECKGANGIPSVYHNSWYNTATTSSITSYAFNTAKIVYTKQGELMVNGLYVERELISGGITCDYTNLTCAADGANTSYQ